METDNEIIYEINIQELENTLFELSNELNENKASNKEIKIQIYNNIRKVIDTMFFSEEYHSDTFFWLND